MTLLSADRSIHRTQYGDSAVMLTVSAADRRTLSATTRKLRDTVLEMSIAGVTDIVAGLSSVLVQYDCTRTDIVSVGVTLDAAVNRTLSTWTDDRRGHKFIVPTVFGGEHGPDLTAVADELHIDRNELVRLFTGTAHFLELIGSGAAPMMQAPELGGSLARRTAPRTSVPAGAVMAAGTNSIIGPAPGPSGWRILGRTPLMLFDIHRDPVAPYLPGDYVSFVEIPASDWPNYEGRSLEPTVEDK
jgi:KipI family sensor histidine kinase inhibitor